MSNIKTRLGSAVGGLLAFTLVAAACGSTQNRATGQPADQSTNQSANQPISAAGKPVYGGSLVYAEVGGGEWDTLDPLESATDSGPYTSMYESFFDFNYDSNAKRWKLIPLLATSWRGGGSLHPTVTLRKGVSFQDGSRWDAKVAAWNIHRMLTDSSGTGESELSDIIGVTATGPYTVSLRLRRPDSGLPVLFSPAAGVFSEMVSESSYQKYGEKGFSSHPMGTGPFELNSFQPDGTTTLKRFSGYWRKADGHQLPFLSKLTFEPIANGASALNQLEAGNLTSFAPTAQQAQQAKSGIPGVSLQVVSARGGFPGTHAYNLKSGPFTNVNLRRAAELALNRKAITSVAAAGFGTPWEIPYWSTSTPGYSKALNNFYPYDPAKARALVRAAHVGNAPITLIYQSREPDDTIAQTMQRMWAAVGLHVSLDPLDPSVYNERLDKGQYDVALYDESTVPDPSLAAQKMGRGGIRNYNHYSDNTVQRLLAAAAGTTNTTVQRRDYTQILKTFLSDDPVSVDFYQPQLNLNSSKLHGLITSWNTDFSEDWLAK